MKVAVTGAKGFVGTALLNRFRSSGIQSRCWTRGSFPNDSSKGGDIEWLSGQLADKESMNNLVVGCDAVVHAGLARSTGNAGRTDRGRRGWWTGVTGPEKPVQEQQRVTVPAELVAQLESVDRHGVFCGHHAP